MRTPPLPSRTLYGGSHHLTTNAPSTLATALSLVTLCCVLTAFILGLTVAVVIHTALLPLYMDVTYNDGQRYVLDGSYSPSDTQTGRWSSHYNPLVANPRGKPLDRRQFTVVSAASNFYFDRLANLVGSIHYWEPKQNIVVYDLGLSNHQRAAVRCWNRVQLVPFPFHLFPKHVRNVFNYSFKLLLIQLALHQYHLNVSTRGYIPWNATEDVTNYEDHSILFLDAGLEVRSPFALDEIAAFVHPELAGPGHWQAQQPNTVDAKTSPVTLEKLGVPLSDVRGRPFCAAGMHAWRLHSSVYYEVILPAIKCALEEECIAPWATGQNNHRWEQSIMSALVYRSGRSCEPDRAWREWDMSQLTESTTRFNHVQLVTRRWHNDKPYIPHLSINNANNVSADSYKIVCASLARVLESDSEDLLLPFAPDAAAPADAIDAAKSDEEIEQIVLSHIDAVKLNSEHPLRQCLKANANSRKNCLPFVRRHLDIMFDIRKTVQRSALTRTAVALHDNNESGIMSGLTLFASILTSWRSFVSFIDVWGFRLAHRLRIAGVYLVISTEVVYAAAVVCFIRYSGIFSSTDREHSYRSVASSDKIDEIIDAFSPLNPAYPYQIFVLRSEHFITRCFDFFVAYLCPPNVLLLLATNTNNSPARRIFSSGVRLSVLMILATALLAFPLLLLHVVLEIIAV